MSEEKRQKLKISLFVISVVVGIIINNILFYFALFVLYFIIFSKDEKKGISYLRKPKFLLSITIITVLPIIFAYGNSGELFHTLEMVVKVLLRGIVLLQTIAILVAPIDRNKIFAHFKKVHPDFEEVFTETVSTMNKFKNKMITSQQKIEKKRIVQLAIFHPIEFLRKVFYKLWFEYNKD
ncbi:hypothetical protein D9V84_03175 [Bacteroidetes/Chlorobi group bacterium Naka2016]|jgi:hypothetical protein|nr:MAG: hypothetical protein D9V84_03175 [Bacteroidetes/Chlorobi group bacterium Naka2016]